VLDAADSQAGQDVQVDLSGVLDELLGHEGRFWLGTAREHGLLAGPDGLTSTTVRQIVAAGCLLGAASQDEALDLLARVPGAPATLKVAEWLRGLYPPPPGSSEWMGSLQPDRLAERHAVTQLASSPALATQCLTGLSNRQASRAVILLARATASQDAAVPLLSQLLPLASDAVAGIQAPHDTLVAIANAIPYPSVRLAAAHAAITTKILHTLPPGTHPAQQARWLEILGVTLSQLGRPADALLFTEEAVAIYRELAAGNPDRYRPDLARSLTNLGVTFSELGRPAEALPVTEEALATYRELAAASPDRYRTDLASCLTSMAGILADLMRHSEAEHIRSEAESLWNRA
jgi:hypothetical protein